MACHSADPDETPHYAALHLGLHCLSLYLFWGLRSSKGVSRDLREPTITTAVYQEKAQISLDIRPV